jgi:hypothetical protein
MKPSKKIILIAIICFITTSSESQTYKDTYIQLASIYFVKTGSSTISLQYRLILYDQSRYLNNVNTEDNILLKAFCSNQEIKRYGEVILKNRIQEVRSILVNDCGVDSNRIFIQQLGFTESFNKDPLSYQRVDLELKHLQ